MDWFVKLVIHMETDVTWTCKVLGKFAMANKGNWPVLVELPWLHSAFILWELLIVGYLSRFSTFSPCIYILASSWEWDVIAEEWRGWFTIVSTAFKEYLSFALSWRELWKTQWVLWLTLLLGALWECFFESPLDWAATALENSQVQQRSYMYISRVILEAVSPACFGWMLFYQLKFLCPFLLCHSYLSWWGPLPLTWG